MTPNEIADELERLAKGAMIESIYPDSLGYIPSANRTDLHDSKRRIAEFVTKQDAYLITALVNNLPAIIAALRQPRADDETVEAVARAIIDARHSDDPEGGGDMPVTEYDRELARAAIGAMR